MGIFDRIKNPLISAGAWILVGAMVSPALAQSGGGPLANFDQYLNQNPGLAQQLEAHPDLIDNKKFMESHPDLRDYLKAHPELKAELKSHPQEFMHREEKLNGWNQPSRGGYGGGYGGVGRFDRGYLAEHPEVAQELSANPSLIDNKQFLASHPGLADYLEDHPQIAAEMKAHPRRFMSREDRMNGWQAPEGRGALGSADNYFDKNPQVAQELKQNPKLIDDPAFLGQHPGLEEYLKTHPQAREYWSHHPYRFMRRENRYSRWH